MKTGNHDNQASSSFHLLTNEEHFYGRYLYCLVKWGSAGTCLHTEFNSELWLQYSSDFLRLQVNKSRSPCLHRTTQKAPKHTSVHRRTTSVLTSFQIVTLRLSSVSAWWTPKVISFPCFESSCSPGEEPRVVESVPWLSCGDVVRAIVVCPAAIVRLFEQP
jgi:hypothetical protein